MAGDRDLDVVLLGATGFTGGLVAEHLARRAGALRWAVAGRDRGKLGALVDRLGGLGTGGREVEVAEVDVSDLAGLRDLAARTRVLATTVGPYARLGERVVQACVEARTDYVDITGEPAFVDRVRERYGAKAARAGARVVHCCGFDSVPHDLGALLTVRALPDDRPITLRGFVSASGSLSGGTWQSALEAIADADLSSLRPGRRSTPARQPGERRARAVPGGVQRVPEIAGWAVPLPTIDPQVVVRSARALPEYGPDFRYSHFARVGGLPKLAVGMTGVAAVMALARMGPARSLLSRLRPSGSGSDARERASGRFRVTLLGEAGDRRVRGEVRGGDPGYTETSKMLGEAALCLAEDRDALPDVAGVLTPAVALGDPYLARLRDQGLRFEVHDGWADRG